MSEWVMVPLVPTPEMIAAGDSTFRTYCLVKREMGSIPVWVAMLAAAPTPPVVTDAMVEAMAASLRDHAWPFPAQIPTRAVMRAAIVAALEAR